VQAETPPEGVDQVVRPNGMLDAVATADFVVVALPLVEATEGIVNAECFDRMKDTAYVIKIARGPLINQADLIEALQ